MEEVKLDGDVIAKARELGEGLKSGLAERDALFAAMERIYFMDWQTNAASDDIVKTISPDGANAIRGAQRLLTTMDPVWDVTVTGEDTAISNKLQKAMRLIWQRSGLQRKKPPHYDAVLSLLLYDECHIVLNSLTEYAKALDGKRQKRAEAMAKLTPFSIQVWNPRDGYPYFDDLGLAGYYRSVQTRVGTALRDYPQAAADLNRKDKKVTDQVQLAMWFDLDSYMVWVDGEVVVAEEWGYDFLPIDVTIADGSGIFEAANENRSPMLATMEKSGMWHNQNMSLTALYTNIRRFGLNPTHLHELGAANQDGQQELNMDYLRGIVEVPYGDKFGPIENKGIVDPALEVGMSLAERKMEESSIYRAALGQSLGANMPFSAIALLSQSGRLPLMGPKLMGGQAIAGTMETALRWYKEMGVDCEGIDLTPTEVPDIFELHVALEVDLPQDKLQNANAATILTSKGLVTNEWAQKNLLQIEDSAEMEKAWFMEQARRVVQQMMLEQMKNVQPQGVPSTGSGTVQPQGPMPPNVPPSAGQMGEPVPGSPAPITMRGPMPPEGGAGMQGLPQNMGGMVPNFTPQE